MLIIYQCRTDVDEAKVISAFRFSWCNTHEDLSIYVININVRLMS